MTFKDRLREARVKAGLSQAALAARAGVTARTVQNYELGTRMPHNLAIAERLAAALETTAAALLGRAGVLSASAAENGGVRAARGVDALLSEVTALFAGGTLPEEDMDAVMEALSAAYFDAKKKNKKYAPHTHKTGEDE